MKRFLLAAALLAVATPCMAQVHVRATVRKDGTYVPAHIRSAPNSTPYDNYSSKGNVNPYSGREGTVEPYGSSSRRSTSSSSSSSSLGSSYSNPYATPPRTTTPSPYTSLYTSPYSTRKP